MSDNQCHDDKKIGKNKLEVDCSLRLRLSPLSILHKGKESLNRLHGKGYISNPIGKAKSVAMTEIPDIVIPTSR